MLCNIMLGNSSVCNNNICSVVRGYPRGQGVDALQSNTPKHFLNKNYMIVGDNLQQFYPSRYQDNKRITPRYRRLLYFIIIILQIIYKYETYHKSYYYILIQNLSLSPYIVYYRIQGIRLLLFVNRGNEIYFLVIDIKIISHL